MVSRPFRVPPEEFHFALVGLFVQLGKPTKRSIWILSHSLHNTCAPHLHPPHPKVKFNPADLVCAACVPNHTLKVCSAHGTDFMYSALPQLATIPTPSLQPLPQLVAVQGCTGLATTGGDGEAAGTPVGLCAASSSDSTNNGWGSLAQAGLDPTYTVCRCRRAQPTPVCHWQSALRCKLPPF